MHGSLSFPPFSLSFLLSLQPQNAAFCLTTWALGPQRLCRSPLSSSTALLATAADASPARPAALLLSSWAPGRG